MRYCEITLIICEENCGRSNMIKSFHQETNGGKRRAPYRAADSFALKSDVEKPPLFELRSVDYHYPDGRKALGGIDLTIHEGDRIALVGHNGAGKTTLVKHLNGLFRPRNGSVLYRGEPLDESRLRAVRLKVGMLFQDPDDQLFCNTIDEDVAFGPYNQDLPSREVERRVEETLRKVGLDGLRYKAPYHLSYGQKKRAALATILSMSPEALILDEPTANLDPKQEMLFMELLADFPGALICISHDLPFLFGLCSRAVVLERGSIHHDFSMEDLLSDKSYLREHGLDFTFRFSCCGNGDHGSHRHHHHTHLEVAAPPKDSGGAQQSEARAKAFIELRDYAYRYPDGTWGVQDVSFSIREGESVALLGENGAGKSTLVSCLAGIYEGKGDYFFDGKRIRGKERKELWRHLGLAFQDPADQLFCPTCIEEVAFGLKRLGLSPSEMTRRVEEAFALVRLTGYEDRVPHHLSAGERKRVALASVLAMGPRALILDEPTANLDPQSEELFCDILGSLSVAKILISHDIDIVSILCQRTIVMHAGRLIRDYSTHDLMHDDRLLSVNGLDYTFKNACCREIIRLQETASD